MNNQTEEEKARYFGEVGIQLRKAGFGTGIDSEGPLTVDYDGMRLCRVNGAGGVQYRESEVEACDGGEALHKAIHIAGVTAEYMLAMEAAPFLKVDGLEDKWKLLAEYGDTVLAGHRTSYGAEFATWERTFDRSGVTIGHYFDDYERAKRDFATRAGLFPRDEAFTKEQLTDLYAHTRWALDNNSAVQYDEYQRVEQTLGQIESFVPEAREQAERFQQEYNSITEQTM